MVPVPVTGTLVQIHHIRNSSASQLSHLSTIQQWGAGRGSWGRWPLRPFLIQRASSPCVSLEVCVHFHSPAGNRGAQHLPAYSPMAAAHDRWSLKAKPFPLSPTNGKCVSRPPTTPACLVSTSHLPTQIPPAFPLLFQLCTNTSKPVSASHTKCTAMPGLAGVISRKSRILHQMAERV